NHEGGPSARWPFDGAVIVEHNLIAVIEQHAMLARLVFHLRLGPIQTRQRLQMAGGKQSMGMEGGGGQFGHPRSGRTRILKASNKKGTGTSRRLVSSDASDAARSQSPFCQAVSISEPIANFEIE